MATIEEIRNLLIPMQDQLATANLNIQKIEESVNNFNKNYCKILLKVKTKKIQYLEQRIREKNIIFFGVDESDNENVEETLVEICQNTMKIQNFSINNIGSARRLGKYINNKTRPILVELSTKKMKIEILQKARLLKDSNIFVEEEYPQEVLAERRKLLPRLKQARKEGCKAFLKYNKLIINEKIFHASTEECSSESNEDDEITTAESNNRCNKEHKQHSSKIDNNFAGNPIRRQSSSLQELNQVATKASTERHAPATTKSTPATKEKKRKANTVLTGPLDKLLNTRTCSQSSPSSQPITGEQQ